MTPDQLTKTLKELDAKGATREEIETVYNAYKQQQTPEPPKGGFVEGVKGVAKEIARPFARFGANVAAAVDIVKGKSKEEAYRERDFGFLGDDITPVGVEGSFLDKLKDTTGAALEVGSNVVPAARGVSSVGKLALRGKVFRGALTGAGYGAAAGSTFGAGRELQQDGSTLGSVAGQAVSGGVIGGLTGGVLGGTAPVIGKVARTVVMPRTVAGEAASSLNTAAGKIQTRVIRPTKPDIRAGYKNENVIKHKIFGTLDQALEKTSTKLKNKTNQLNEGINKASDKPVVSLNNLISRTRKKSQPGSADIDQFGTLADKNKAFDAIEKELDMLYGVDADGNSIWRTKDLNFQELIKLKRRVGLRGAFEYDPLTKKTSPRGEAFNDLYDVLKKEAEANAGGAFAQLNREISELIPIEQAIIRRLPIDERNNAIGLIDSISGGLAVQAGDPTVLSIALANRAFKSGNVANRLSRVAQRLERFAQKSSRTPNSQSAQIQTPSATSVPNAAIAATKPQPGNSASKLSPNSESFAGFGAGFSIDEDGNITFNPEMAIAGFAGMTVATRVRSLKEQRQRMVDAMNATRNKNVKTQYRNAIRQIDGAIKVEGKKDK